MELNLLNYASEAVEYSVNLHTVKLLSGENSMYITITKNVVDQGNGDYTTVFNGLPIPKLLKKTFGKDHEACAFAIKALKEDACKYAIAYWNFVKDEWESNLDLAYKHYKKYCKR